MSRHFRLWTGSQSDFNEMISKVISCKLPAEPQEKYGFMDILNTYRDEIDNINNENWKKVRWYINEYDFLVKDPIINRAFYKYWEIINEFEIFDSYSDNDVILHCAEAPGGFIQGSSIYLQLERRFDESKHQDKSNDDGWNLVDRRRKKKIEQTKVFSISLNKDLPQYKSYNLPSYNKNILNKHVCITYGKDDTGDINNWENIHYINKKARMPFYLVTADGGFDEGTDFNNKEQLHYCLILSEIYAGIISQSQGGHFILKMFDIFTETSIQFLYLLSLCYKDVYIYKPKTSRPTNSEKYLVCKNFCLSATDKSTCLKHLERVSLQLKAQTNKYVTISLFKKLPSEFVDSIKEINLSTLQKQCAYLQRAVDLCKDTHFLDQYDDKLSDSLRMRREVFNMWQKTYNLDAYV